MKRGNPHQTVTSSTALTCAISCDPTLNPYVFLGVGAWICDVSAATATFCNIQLFPLQFTSHTFLTPPPVWVAVLQRACLSVCQLAHLRNHVQTTYRLQSAIAKVRSVAEWLTCWTQAQKGPGSNCSRDAVG